MSRQTDRQMLPKALSRRIVDGIDVVITAVGLVGQHFRALMSTTKSLGTGLVHF